MCCCVQVINDTRIVKARKDHRDSCREFINEHLWDFRNHQIRPNLSFKEWRLIAESIRDNWTIKKGEMYEVQVNVMDGRIYSFKNKIGLADICHKYELFPDC